MKNVRTLCIVCRYIRTVTPFSGFAGVNAGAHSENGESIGAEGKQRFSHGKVHLTWSSEDRESRHC